MSRKGEESQHVPLTRHCIPAPYKEEHAVFSSRYTYVIPSLLALAIPLRKQSAGVRPYGNHNQRTPTADAPSSMILNGGSVWAAYVRGYLSDPFYLFPSLPSADLLNTVKWCMVRKLMFVDLQEKYLVNTKNTDTRGLVEWANFSVYWARTTYRTYVLTRHVRMGQYSFSSSLAIKGSYAC